MEFEFNRLRQPVGKAVDGWTPLSRPQPELLIGNYCRLEPLELARHADDLNAAFALDAEGSSWTYLPYGPFATLDEFKDWLARDCEGNDPLFFAIVIRGTNRAAGVASFLRITPDSGSLEIGHIHFSPLLQHTPAGTEAVYLLIERAFALGYRRCEWKCDALNAASRAAARRLGFSFEGIFRQATVRMGRNRDTAWYAMIDSDWPAIRAAHRQWLHPDNFDVEGRQRTRLSVLTAPFLVSGIADTDAPA